MNTGESNRSAPFYLRLRDTAQILCDAEDQPTPQWWAGTSNGFSGARIERFAFVSARQAMAFAKLLCATRGEDGFTLGDIRVCRIVPPIAERLEDVT